MESADSEEEDECEDGSDSGDEDDDNDWVVAVEDLPGDESNYEDSEGDVDDEDPAEVLSAWAPFANLCKDAPGATD